MPDKTLDAVADHGEIAGDTGDAAHYDDAKQVLDALERLGISYAEVADLLEREGVDKFEKSWGELLADVQDELTKASQRRRVRRGGQVTNVALGVVAAGAGGGRDRASTCRRWSTTGVASRLFAQDATLWGPEAESEAAIRLSWVGLARSSRPLVGEVAALRDAAARAGASTTSCSAGWAARRWHPRSSAPRPASS